MNPMMCGIRLDFEVVMVRLGIQRDWHKREAGDAIRTQTISELTSGTRITQELSRNLVLHSRK